ncbi:MAG TPA: T9SS type A sorting domain-containing protein [Bacteroidia bacterium]|nr:T9SS type A sorting domain-containing protein [Bacteroidia bacterium]
MRNCTLLVAIMGIVPILLQAQPTIVQADFPTPGTLWVDFGDSRTGVHTITPAGPSQTWNYASAFIVDDTTVLNFILPSAAPNGWGSNFPSSGVCLYTAADSTAEFFKSLANGFYADGVYYGSQTTTFNVLDFNPDQLLVPANFTYNSTRNNTSLIVLDQIGPPNIRVKAYTIQSFLGDAYGSLVTPSGSYPSTLRIKETDYSIDSTFIDITGTGTYNFVNTSGPSDTSIVYNWLKNGPMALIMSIDYDPINQQSSGADYYSLTPVGISEVTSGSSPMLVYPNPTDVGWIRFDMENADGKTLRIFSVEGKLLREENIAGLNSITLSTGSFAKGIYFYEVLSNQNEKLHSGKFSVMK